MNALRRKASSKTAEAEAPDEALSPLQQFKLRRSSLGLKSSWGGKESEPEHTHKGIAIPSDDSYDHKKERKMQRKADKITMQEMQKDAQYGGHIPAPRKAVSSLYVMLCLL